MKKVLTLLIIALVFLSCDLNKKDDKGTLSLNLTDAPVSVDGLSGVYITFDEIAVNIEDAGWQSAALFENGLKVNLLDLTGGITTALAENVELPSGQINQIRFLIDAPADGEDSAGSNCYLEYDDGTTHPLTIPSGTKTGYKATGSFAIPVNGSVTVTADFDAGKSLVYSGGTYKLKPTVRLIVDGEAGSIEGTLTVGTPAAVEGYSIYAYEDGVYNDSEAAENSDGIQFSNSVSSCFVEDDNSYKLAFLAEGTYDLVVVSNDGSVLAVAGTSDDVSVIAGEATALNISVP